MSSAPGSPTGEPEEPLDHEPSDAEIDRRFAELTAGLQIDDDHESTARPEPEQDHDPEPAEPAEPPSPLPGPRDYEVAEEPDEGFEPGEPESLDGLDPLLAAAWVGAVGGPIAGILLLILWPATPSIVWWCVLAATLAGWGIVFWRLPRSRNDDDDGARV